MGTVSKRYSLFIIKIQHSDVQCTYKHKYPYCICTHTHTHINPYGMSTVSFGLVSQCSATFDLAETLQLFGCREYAWLDSATTLYSTALTSNTSPSPFCLSLSLSLFISLYLSLSLSFFYTHTNTHTLKQHHSEIMLCCLILSLSHSLSLLLPPTPCLSESKVHLLCYSVQSNQNPTHLLSSLKPAI